METKTCIKCGIEKNIDEFVFEKRTNKYLNTCLECNKKYHKEYSLRRKEQNKNKIYKIDLNEKKICNKCKIEKNIQEFSFDKTSGKYINTCKKCKVKATKKYYEEHKEEYQQYFQEYRENNKEKIDEYFTKYRIDNAEKRRAYSRQYNEEHKEQIKIKSKKYREEHLEEFKKRDKEYALKHKKEIAARYKQWAKEHSEQLAQYNKQYREKNAEEISKKRKAYSKEHRKEITAYYLNKREEDPLFKLSTQVRGLIRISLKKNGYSKKSSTYDILGCDYQTLMIHLKETWLKNYGKEWNGEPYHIDHIIPLATATSEKEIIDLCYYKNLQMLTPKDNLVKNKYIIDENK